MKIVPRMAAFVAIFVILIFYVSWIQSDELVESRGGFSFYSSNSNPRDSRFFWDDNYEDEHFTLVIQSFNRTDLLFRLINHYMSTPSLSKIIVVWNNLEMEAPWEEFEELEPLPVPVVFLTQKTNSLNNRFKAYTEIDTEGVILMDDDIFVSISDLTFAFSVWRQFRDRIVGFVARKHVINDNGVLSYGGFELMPENVYSMVLTGAAFVHQSYMEQYLNELPNSVHRLVDDKQNCEDIAFNMLVAKKTENPPIFVQPLNFKNLDSETESPYKGLWHRWNHSIIRSQCLNSLVKIFGNLHLRYNTLKVVQTKDCLSNH